MIKPERLYPGDRAAIISLSWGGLGEPKLIHRYLTAKKRLERDFGLIVEPTAHALSGEKFLSEHPEIRARDLIAAFRDPQIKAVFCAIGEIKKRPFYNDDGTFEMKPSIDLGLTIDERIADGYYYAKTVRLLKTLLENPQLLDEPLQKEVDC